MKTKTIHNNKPQLMSALIEAWLEVAIMGRRLGKTTGILARRFINCAYEMPQSTGALVNHNYESILGRTLPSLEIGLSKWGFKRDRDFYVGRFGPKSWKKPYFCPVDPKYFVHVRNGTGMILSTQHGNIGNLNGATLDWGNTDEAKFLNKKKYDEEVVPALSGNHYSFKEKSCFGSWLFITDMPRDPKANWLFEYEKLMDPELINLIANLSGRLNKLKFDALNANGNQLAVLKHQIKVLSAELNEFRKNSIFYHEASSLDNIEVLGEQYLKSMKKTLPELEYRMSILNERILHTDLMFYSGFSPSVHGYHANDDELLHNMYYSNYSLANMTCKKDTDLLPSEGLHIALDYGASFNGVVTGQSYLDEFKLLSGLHVTDKDGGKRLPQLAKDWCDYYEPHKANNNVVHYYYDHTAVGSNALDNTNYAAEWVAQLTRRGWQVIPYYIGQQPGYVSRFNFWQKLLAGHKDYPRFSYNKDNCESWETAMLSAGTREVRGKLEKDKTTERPTSNVPAEHATHYTDAGDTLMYSVMVKKPQPINPGTAGRTMYV